MANFQHREYLGTVTASTGFSLNKYSVNPGVASTFPWLGQVANNFEKYKINRMSFVFNSTASDSVTAGTNSSVGVLILGASYDSADPDFASRFEMLNYRGTRSQKLSSSFQFPVDTRMFQQQNLWVRDGPPPANTDIRLYDACTFFLATDAAQGIFACGELWVVYDIDLMGPKLYDTLSLSANLARFEGDTATQACPLGNAAITGGPYTIMNTMGAWITPDTENVSGRWNTIHVPTSPENEYFKITLLYKSVANDFITGRNPAILGLLVNCTALNYYLNNTDVMFNSAGQTASAVFAVYVFRITTVQQNLPTKVNLSLAAGSMQPGSTPMNCICEVIQIPTAWRNLRSAGTGTIANIDVSPFRNPA
jgi:hypothetical protein